MKFRTISDKLKTWYRQQHRDLPWRKTVDPYKIWLSEIILQQTRVEQGLPYFEKFVRQFPTVESLAAADEEHVLKLWQGLGYYSRARNLHFTAQYIASEYKGKFPAKYEQILALKGVGRYTAAAIASFAYKLPYPVVDGNVTRVISRLFLIEEAVNEAATLKVIHNYADQLLDKDEPDIHNQAMMELGALICTPVNPSCNECPLSDFCFAYAKSAQNDLPRKTRKVKVKNRYFHYFVVQHNGKVLLQKRQSKDIWQGLYEFPLVELPHENKRVENQARQEINQLLERNVKVSSISEPYQHILTHQRIKAKFYVVELDKNLIPPEALQWINKSDVEKYAVPRLIDRYLEDTELLSLL